MTHFVRSLLLSVLLLTAWSQAQNPNPYEQPIFEQVDLQGVVALIGSAEQNVFVATPNLNNKAVADAIFAQSAFGRAGLPRRRRRGRKPAASSVSSRVWGFRSKNRAVWLKGSSSATLRRWPTAGLFQAAKYRPKSSTTSTSSATTRSPRSAFFGKGPSPSKESS